MDGEKIGFKHLEKKDVPECCGSCDNYFTHNGYCMFIAFHVDIFDYCRDGYKRKYSYKGDQNAKKV